MEADLRRHQNALLVWSDQCSVDVQQVALTYPRLVPCQLQFSRQLLVQVCVGNLFERQACIRSSPIDLLYAGVLVLV